MVFLEAGSGNATFGRGGWEKQHLCWPSHTNFGFETFNPREDISRYFGGKVAVISVSVSGQFRVFCERTKDVLLMKWKVKKIVGSLWPSSLSI